MTLERIEKGNWAYCLSQLSKRKLATASDVMQDRIKDYRNHTENGTWIAENSNVIDGRILLARAKFNPLIKYANQAVKAQIQGEFYLTPEIVDASEKPYTQLLNEIAEADADKPFGKKRVADLGEVVTHDVPTDSFADDDTITFLARGEKLANQYGLFLRNKLPEELRLQSVRVHHASFPGKNYAREVWLCALGPNSVSYFNCDYVLYDGGGSAFGVPLTREGGSPKISKPKVRCVQ